MALTEDETFGTVVPGFVTDSEGRLSVVTAGDSTERGTVVAGFVTDADGRLVVSEDATVGDVGEVIPGFATDADGALALTRTPDITTTSKVYGFQTDSEGRLAIANDGDVARGVTPGYLTDPNGWLGITGLGINGYADLLLSYDDTAMLLPLSAPSVETTPELSQLYDTFVGKPDGPLTVADTGQTWGSITGGTVPDGTPVVLNDVFTNTADGAGSAAGYAEIELSGLATSIGATFKLSAGENTGAAVLIVTNESIATQGVIPDGPCHMVIGLSTWAFAVLDGSDVDIIASGTHTLTPDTEYTCEVLMSGEDVAIKLPNDTWTRASDPRIASLAGNWACFEVFQSDASTDAKASFVDVWADVSPRVITNGLEDVSGNDRNGTAVNGNVQISDGPVGTAGATDFNGTSPYITTGYNPFTNGTTRTFMAWVWRDTTAAIHTIFGGAAATNVPHLRCSSGSNDVVFLPDQANTAVTWTAAMPGTAQWVHVALVFREAANTAELFINGVSQTSKAAAVAYTASPGNISLAARNTSGTPAFLMDGKMAWFSVTEGELSEAQILALVNAA